LSSSVKSKRKSLVAASKDEVELAAARERAARSDSEDAEVPEKTPEQLKPHEGGMELPSAHQLTRQVHAPSDVFDTVGQEYCIFGASVKVGNGRAFIEPEYDDKKLEFVGASTASTLRQMLSKSGIGIACKKGKKPEQPNQDNIFLSKVGQLIVCGVADGHGPDGHWVSHWIARFTLRLVLLEVCKRLKPPSDETMTKIFALAHSALVIRAESDGFNLSMSGSTLTVCIIDVAEKTVMSAWVGDSRAAMGAARPRHSEALTVDHKPNQRGERQRIVSHGGEVVKIDGDVNYRVFVQGGDVPGLAMSRALGDLIAHSVGVSHAPMIKRAALSEFMLCCSDGVWEFISTAAAVQMVGDMGRDNAHEAAEALALESRKMWLQEEETITDDISVIIVYSP